MSRTSPRSLPGLPRRAADRLPQPVLAAERARKREDLLPRHRGRPGQDRRPGAGRAAEGPGQDRPQPGRVINKRKVAKHFTLGIPEGRITWQRDQASIAAEAATDGIYVIRTPVPAETLDAAGTVTAYKRLSRLERDFRSIKADDLDLRPIWHRLEDRVHAHVLICMLACYLTWHLRKAWAPLTYADEHPRPAPTRRPRPPVTIRRRQGRPQDRPRQTAHPQLPRPARPTWPPSPATTCATAT